MKLPEEATPTPSTGDSLTKRTASSVDLSQSSLLSSSSSSSSSSTTTAAATAAAEAAPVNFRRRSSSLDVTSFGKYKSSTNWLQLFVRRSSTDFSIGDTMSPAASLESIPSCVESEPRSRHSSGDVIRQPANQTGGLVGVHPEQQQQQQQQRHLLVRQKSESSLWNWKLFNAKADDKSRIRKISEMDETDVNVNKTKLSDLSPSGGATSESSSGLWKMATRISARDLNALSPSGDI